MNKKNRLLPGLLLLTALPGYGEILTLGIQGGSYGTAYNTRHADYWALPYIGYDTGHWFIDGTEAGLYLVNHPQVQITSRVYYATTAYDASDGRTRAMRKLNSRHSTMMAGISGLFITPAGGFSVTVAGDTLDNSNGITASGAYILLQQWGALTLVPQAGVDWSSGQHTRYYYGISPAESARSGLAEWRPHNSYIPYIQLAMNYAWSPQWNSWGMVTARFFPSTISASPMVNNHGVREVTLGITYSF